MGKLVHRHAEYIVIEDDHSKSYVIINTLGTYHSHGHLKKLKTAKLVIKLMEKNIVPDSDYLRGTVLRISLDEKYKSLVLNRIEKEKQKPKFVRIQKGVIRK